MLHPFSSVPEPSAPLLASLKRFPLTSLQPPQPRRVMVPLIAVALPTDAAKVIIANFIVEEKSVRKEERRGERGGGGEFGESKSRKRPGK